MRETLDKLLALSIENLMRLIDLFFAPLDQFWVFLFDNFFENFLLAKQEFVDN